MGLGFGVGGWFWGFVFSRFDFWMWFFGVFWGFWLLGMMALGGLGFGGFGIYC